MTVFTAHWHHDLLKVTAQELLARYSAEELPHVLLLMPNRRSCIAMREAFKSFGNETLLLPRILPLADAEIELLFSLVRSGEAFTQIPPAMSRWQQRMILVELVKAFEQKRTGRPPNLLHVLSLADDIIEIQNNLLREGVDISSIDLRSIAFGDTAKHWQVNAQFLNILFHEWPLIEKEKGMITKAGREQALLQAMNGAWQNHQPAHPIWMIGSTGSMPAVRELMKTIHAMEHGFVVLPALDLTIQESVSIGQAQHYLQLSLAAMGNPDVKLLGDNNIKPRQTTWMGQGSDVGGIEYICAEHEEEEAGIISLIVREALEHPKKIIAVVTPSPLLMQRVKLQLQRYDIQVNTPQGKPLAHSAEGQAWWYLLNCLREEVGIISLLELLHVVDYGEEPENWHGFLRIWRAKCRGVQSRSRISERIRRLSSDYPIAQSVALSVHEMEGLYPQSFRLSKWIEHLSAIMKAMQSNSIDGHESVIAVMEELAGASGEMELNVDDAVAIIQEALLKPLRVPDLSAHPRVFVLSPIEARLQCFDRVILAGFNEGDWPIGYQPSPWLNLGQRAKLGMSPPEAHATLTAHDIQMLGMAEEVFITRSAKVEGTPTQPSRYLVKLEAQLGKAGVSLNARPWKAWWEDINDADYVPITPDAPKPAQRPTTLKVTSLRNLFSDPYAIYAEYVLGLKQLDPFDKAPDAATFGSLVHKIIEEMIKEKKSPDDADWLMSRTSHLEDDARLYALWLPRIRNILRFVAAKHAQRGGQVEPELEIQRDIGVVNLKGKIDRLEKHGTAYSIHDYKTGGAPEKSAMKLGLEPQLIAYALMLSQEHGILPEQLLYWELPKARHAGALVEYELGEQSLEQHIAALWPAITRILSPDYAFQALNSTSPYAGVSRNDEWAA